MSSLLKLNAFEDLQKLLIRQKECSEKAKRELNRVTDSTVILYAPDGSFSETTTNEITRKVSNLLTNYATLPTLSEFVEKPSLMQSASWGGSFGVATIVGTVILKSLSEFSEFPPNVVKPVFIKVLGELYAASQGSTEETSIMERVMENLNFSIRDRDGNEILGDKRDRIIKGKVALLLEIMSKLMEDYKMIVSSREEGGTSASSAITPMGSRIYLHLRDIESYLSEIEVVYRQLSEKKKAEPLITSINQ